MRTGLDLFRSTVAGAPEKTFIRYFGESLSFAEVDRQSDALAGALGARGVGPGDRVALYLQNIPQFPISLLAVWKLGAIVVPINPMLRHHELDVILTDSGANALICLQSLYHEVVTALPGPPDLIVTTSELDFGHDHPPVLFDGVRRDPTPKAEDLLALLGEGSIDPGRGSAPVLTPDDVACLTYTSGTTGPPKGAMNLHRNFVVTAETHRTWMALGPDDVVLAVAPLFHITGIASYLGPALRLGTTLVLTYRFNPAIVAFLAEEERATFTVAAITAFIALLGDDDAMKRDLSALTVYSGGAPVPQSVVEKWRARTGTYIHNIYGLTEATGPTHAVPLGAEAPVDPASGALSVGLTQHNTVARIVDGAGAELGPGEIGEIVISGPQFIPGYWNKPEETSGAFVAGEMRTGDVGFMDDDGWLYVVDRKKDLIIASGYKVWPRDVEDVLYTHAAVREAAVIGVADDYRGETVKAFVSLRDGSSVEPDEIITYCRAHLAAYKCPRDIAILPELPKTASGKILRRQLRGG